MTPTETLAILKQLDGWPVQHHSTKKVQEAIQAAVEMIERLEAAEKERDAVMMLADKLALALNTSNHERDALRAKVEAMEKQEPVAWLLECQTLGGDTGWILSWTQSGAGLCNRLQGAEHEKPLYTLPGAQGEEK